jgi:hypothetical protein
MPVQFATKTALGLMIGLLAFAPAAHADNAYQPYYMLPNRSDLQFSNVPPPQDLPVQPQSNLGHAAPWQPVQATTATPPVVDTQEWTSQPALFHYNNEVWLSAGTSFLNYEESVKPLPDSEHGWLPSIAGGGSFMATNNFYVSLEGSTAFGNAHYNGALFASPSTPITGTTHENITTGDAKVGQGFYLMPHMMLIPYVDLGYRYWKRDLSAGQIEDYHNFETSAGMIVEVEPADGLILSAYGSGGTTLASKMTAGSYTYDLGDTGVYKVGGKVAVEMTRQIELFSTLDYEHFRFAQSPVVNEALEPGSGTNDTTVRVGIGYHFR